MLFAFKVCKHVKSNAIIYVKNKKTIGIGAGQMSRVDSAKIASQKNIYSVAGGGDTIALLNHARVIDQLNFVSTAGGAFLEFLEGKEIPGIKSLN